MNTPRVAALLVAAVVAGTVSAGSTKARAGPSSLDKRCAPGFVHAVIGGTHGCLRRGQRCQRTLDRQYHRYRFHCHRGRLTGGRAAPLGPATDLALTQAATPNPAAVGEDVVHTATVANEGPLEATEVRLQEMLPSAVTVVSATATAGTCVVSPRRINCELGSLAPGADVRVTFVLRAPSEGTASVHATVASALRDSDTSDNTTRTATTIAAPNAFDFVEAHFQRPSLIGGTVQNSVVARSDARGGNPRGSFDTRTITAQETFFSRGRITCLSVSGNRAYAAGVIEESNRPIGPVGSFVLFQFTDNGSPGAGRDTNIVFFGAESATTCARVGDEPPITSGEIVVNDAS